MSIRRTTQAVIAVLLTLGLIPAALPAEDTTATAEVAPAIPSRNEIELGAGYVFDDAYHFGRYNGLVDQGAYVIGDIMAKQYGEAAGYWRLRGTNLGLDSRYLRLDSGVQGQQEYFIEYDQLPDYENDTARTPFRPAGSSRLLLPPNFDIDNVNSFLLPFDQQTERKRLGVGAKILHQEPLGTGRFVSP